MKYYSLKDMIVLLSYKVDIQTIRRRAKIMYPTRFVKGLKTIFSSEEKDIIIYKMEEYNKLKPSSIQSLERNIFRQINE